MTEQWIADTKRFLSKASGFIFIISTLVYLILYLMNSALDNFVIIYFKMNILLAISIINAGIFILTWKNTQNAQKCNENY